jgi:AraC-like DNA-binding protein
MKKNNIIDINLETARQWQGAQYMEDGLVLTHHIDYAPIPQHATRMNFILMALCLRGKAQYCIDTHEQTVNPGDLMFISERHIVDNYMASPNFECLCIMVSTAFYHDFVQNVKNVSSLLLFSMNNPVVHLTSAEIQTYSNYYQTIREKMANTEHPYRTELVKAWLLSMFYDMSGVIYRVEQQGQKVQTRADAFFAQFIRLLELNFRNERRVSWYAEQLGITAKYLSEVVKQVSKRTPTDWIDNYVILEMRVLLKNSTKNIKEIADELHFPNQSFLGKYFRERVGISPRKYRISES